MLSFTYMPETCAECCLENHDLTGLCSAGMLAALAEQGKSTFTHCTQSHGFIYILGSNIPF